MARTTILLLLIAVVLAAGSAAFADGILLPVERPHSRIVVPNELFTVKYHHVNVSIQDQLCTTKVDQIFHNDTGMDREGMYIFPMPEGSAITRFSMFAGEQEIRGKVLGKAEARGIYESIVRQRRDPALLEYIDRNTFQASVYPIPAHGDKRIRLDYSEVAGKSGNTCRYVYPLSTERFSNKPLEDCKVIIKITSKRAITNIYSPTHAVEVDRNGDFAATVTWRAKNVKPDTDLVLYYTVSNDDIGMDLVAYRESGKKGFYMLLASPRVESDKTRVQPKNVVFILDRTGSMAGDNKIDQAKAALKFCVNTLRAEDRFNVITFNETPDLLFDSMRAPTAEARKKALAAIDDIEATGGTNIDQALSKGLAQFREGVARNYVVFLTDGLPTVGETNPDTILNHAKAANKKNAKLFAFGVGYDVNTHFLDKLSEQNKGDTDYVRPNEDIEAKVSAFFGKVSEPLLSDVKVRISGVTVSDSFPGDDLPDIFKGSQLIIFGRYTGSGAVTVELSGVANGARKTFTLRSTLPESREANNFMPQLWASRKIGYLLDEIRLHSNKELIDEVVRLSKEYGIPTEFTSFLADDRSMTANTQNSFGFAREKARKADAFDTGSYGVAQSRNSRDMKNQAQLPASAPIIGGLNRASGDAPPALNMRFGGGYYDANDQYQAVGNVQNVAQRTFYQRGSFWEDGGIPATQKFVQIRQFSAAHFKLLKAYPKLSQFSTLGNVRLMLENKQAVEIGPNGKDSLTDSEMNDLLRGIPAGSRRSSLPSSIAIAAIAIIGLSLPASFRLRR